jgi:hypothetical protein
MMTFVKKLSINYCRFVVLSPQCRPSVSALMLSFDSCPNQNSNNYQKIGAVSFIEPLGRAHFTELLSIQRMKPKPRHNNAET